MDPITHGVIGLAISTFSGQPVSLDNPIAFGAAVGAMAPDMDFVVRLFKNDMVYLKAHRGPSHSVPVLVVTSLVIAAGISYLMPGTVSFMTLWFWTFLGALSHTVFDMLNSYGAMLFTKKMKANLLTLYDPFLAIISIHLIVSGPSSPVVRLVDTILFAGYLIYRVYKKESARRFLTERFSSEYKDVDVAVLPSLKSFYKWDFVISSRSHSVVGSYNGFNGEVRILKEFDNVMNGYMEVFDKSNVGQYFKDWTPHYHLVATSHDDHIHLKAIDLRYHFRNEFMHHATLILEHDHSIRDAFVHPYRLTKRIRVNEAA